LVVHPAIRRCLVISLALAACACSLSRLDQVPCEDDVECRVNFGLGNYCDTEGFCVLVDEPRCQLYPEGTSLPLDPASTVLFGAMFNQSNETHQARFRSARLAAAHATQYGGLEGRDIAVAECTIEENTAYDDLDQAGAVELVAETLATRIGVSAIVGPASSSDVEVAYNTIASLDTLLISPSATSISLTDLDGISASDEEPGLLWRTAAPDSLQGQVIAADMDMRGVASVALVSQSGAYGDSLAEIFADAFTGTIQLFPFSDASGRDAATASAGDAGADEVLFIASEITDVVAFLETAGQIADYDDMPLFLTDAAATATVLTGASSASHLYDQVRGTRPSLGAGDLYDTFVASYGAAYDGQNVSSLSFTAHTYDAAWLVIYGTAWAYFHGDPSRGTDVAKGLRKVSAGASTEIRATTWNTVKASFEEGVSVDVVGTSGNLDYDPVTEETTSTIDVWTINGAGTDFVTEYVSE
jgi:branched-chain amino acid transport system substrate-binding protein